MSSVEVSFEKLLLAIWQFHLPELSPSWFSLPVQILRSPHIHGCTISNCFCCGSLNFTIHLGLQYYLPNFSGYLEALSSGEYSSACAYKFVRYLKLTCPIIGPAHAILSQVHKPP